MWLFIEPSDVWLFRDGRPFDAGADHRAASVFPPHPTTIQGAIRRQILALRKIDLDTYTQRDGVDAIGEEIGLPPKWNAATRRAEGGTLGSIQLRGPFVARREADGIMPYFPCPADVLMIEQVVKLQPVEEPVFKANWPSDAALRPLTHEALAPADETRAWLSARSLSRYLGGKALIVVDLIAESRLFERESRFGVGIDSSVKRPSEGLLYQVEYVHPADDVGLLVEVSGIPSSESKWNKTGELSLGGEMRAAHYTRIDAPAAWPMNASDAGQFKVYLATPALFDAGWQSTRWQMLGLELHAAAVARAQPIGGWDVATNSQKPMRRYVPAGSVYYFKGEAAALPPSLCDDATDNQIGFGHYFTGRW